MAFQGFSIGSNIWLSKWSNDNETVVNGTVDTGKRDMYLGVYGALGIGQGKLIFNISLLHEILQFCALLYYLLILLYLMYFFLF